MSEPKEFDVNPYAAPPASSAVGAGWIESGDESLRKVARGISCVYYGVVIALLAIIATVLGSILAFGVLVTLFIVLPIIVVGIIFLVTYANLIDAMRKALVTGPRGR